MGGMFRLSYMVFASESTTNESVVVTSETCKANTNHSKDCMERSVCELQGIKQFLQNDISKGPVFAIYVVCTLSHLQPG